MNLRILRIVKGLTVNVEICKGVVDNCLFWESFIRRLCVAGSLIRNTSFKISFIGR